MPKAKKKKGGHRIHTSEITKVLGTEIRKGKYGADMPFPSLTAIMNRFDISRPCAAKSVAELKQMGLVVTKVGCGTRVRNRTIGVCIPGTADSEFFCALQDGIRSKCLECGVEMVSGDFPMDHEGRADEAVRLARHFVERNVAGVIMQPIGFNAKAAKINSMIEDTLNTAGIPVVIIDYDIAQPPRRSIHDLVAIDNFNAGRRIGLHLLTAGAKNICCLLRRLSADSVWTRFDGVDSAVKRVCGKNATIIKAEPDDVGAVAKGLKKFHPDAIVCSNDIAANNLLKTLNTLNVRVPEDVMITGFDDVRLAAEMTPRLTTIHQPCEQLAAAAFETVMSRIDNRTLPPRQVLLDAPLVARESTKRQARPGSATAPNAPCSVYPKKSSWA